MMFMSDTEKKALREQELRDAYTVLYGQVRMSKKLFADQYRKYGMAGINSLIELFSRNHEKRPIAIAS